MRYINLLLTLTLTLTIQDAKIAILAQSHNFVGLYLSS